MQQSFLTQSNKVRKNRQLKKKCLRRGPKISTGTGTRKKRQEFSSRHPLHITIRLQEGLPNLRSKTGARLVKKCILGARDKGIRVSHFAILSNHVHLYVEGKNSSTLQSSMRSFMTIFALGIRAWAVSEKLNSKKIKHLGLFRGRYHVEVLKTPAQVKNALKYVLSNPCKHFKKSLYIDKYCSLAAFPRPAKLWSKKEYVLIKKHFQLGYHLAFKEKLNSFLDPPQLWLSTVGWEKI